MRAEQLRRCADEADSGNKYTACQHLHFKPIGAGLALTKLVCQDFPLMKLCLSGLLPDETSLSGFSPDEAELIRILKFVCHFYQEKR